MNTSTDTAGGEHACCHAPAQPPAETLGAASCCHDEHAAHDAPAAHAGHAHASGWKAAASVTVHCLTGCAIGEFTGLAIGVSLGFPVHVTITLAVVLSFVSGFALTLLPMLKRGFDLATAFRTVWLGEVISITTMEIVMNLVDYHMGGMRGVSLAHARYWESFGLSLIAGYLAAWPVNKWMLSRNMKKCH